MILPYEGWTREVENIRREIRRARGRKMYNMRQRVLWESNERRPHATSATETLIELDSRHTRTCHDGLAYIIRIIL